ncbi:MAG: FGGY family carbohydrate kinase [Acidimicrobiia bacterium]|nr:FGGY family carbohydrate kinase [Acidimicrobiia bacterium]
MPLVLGVDSSPHATTVELRDSDDGRLYGSGQVAHPPEVVHRVEQDPALWWQALVDARHDAGGALGIASVAVAAQQPGLIVLDEGGRLIRPARVRDDLAASPDAERLVEALGPDEWARACGSVPATSFTITKLAWLRRTEPDDFARIAAVLQPHDWLTYRLSRKVVTDRGDASATGYWSPGEERWRPDLLELVDPDKHWTACLPRVLGPEEPAGDREGVVIGAGTGDAMGAALGLALEPHDVVVDLGPSGKVFTVRERPTEDPTGAVMGFADATGRYLPLVWSLDVASIIESFAGLLGVDRGRFDMLAMSAPSGANGLVLVPALDGHLAGRPVDAGGVLSGIRGDVTPELVARAVVEGVACSILDALDALRSADVPVGGRLFLIGQGSRSHAIQEALAGIGERPLSIPKGDRVATGACVQAAAAVLGRPPGEIAASWQLHDARELEPTANVDAEEIRAAYRAARERISSPDEI